LKQFIYRKSKISSSPPHRSPKKRYAVGSPKPGPPGKPVDRRQAVMKIALPGKGRWEFSGWRVDEFALRDGRASARDQERAKPRIDELEKHEFAC
jgi:hypothetical protein